MNIDKIKPELISGVGDWSSLHAAVEAGCDSVYFGVKGINMRNFASNFDVLEIKKVMKFLHENKKKGYLVLNVIIFNKELDKIKNILEEAKLRGVDGVIFWDMAVFPLLKELGISAHLSTQASVSNYESLKFYSSLGIDRVVLARECSLKDVRDVVIKINKDNISCSVEIFIHGAMCVSVSGRCFLSQHSFFKSAKPP